MSGRKIEPSPFSVGRVPYLNSAPFFAGLTIDGVDWVDQPPRQCGLDTEAGRIVAAPLPLADYLRLQDRVERLGNLGIAAHGRCGSTLLFSRIPIRQLEGATIAVTEESSTTAMMLRLILEQRYRLTPPPIYQRGDAAEAEARLVIGDEALRRHYADRRDPYETDVAFEWWLWQHAPAVFAVWVVRKDAPAEEKQRLLRHLQRQLAGNLGRLDALAAERAESLGAPKDELAAYLTRFVYRFGDAEEQAIKLFERLAREHQLIK